MKKHLSILFLTAALALPAGAASITWAASFDNGFSLANGTDLSQGSLIRLGYFYNSGSGLQLTDAQILALAGNPTQLNTFFKEAASTSIGANVGADGHFSRSSEVDTTTLSLAGKQMYLWVFNSSTLNAATQQGVFYWSITNTTTNPDAAPFAPGLLWSFPTDEPVAGSTTVDITDLTTGNGLALASGARIPIGGFGTGTSNLSGAPNFNLAVIVPEPSTAFLGLLGVATLLGRRRRASTAPR